MTTAGFLDELVKLAATGQLELEALVVGRRAPLHSVGNLLRATLHKRASDLRALHDEVAPTPIEVRPDDASTRSPAGQPPSLIRPGSIGAVTPAVDPIDREKFNRVWSQPIR